jgi:hypothetical protein
MPFQSTLSQHLSNPPATRRLLGAQRFTILRGITLHQAARCAMRVRLSCKPKKAGKRHMLFGIPVSTTAERRTVFA